MAAAISSQLAGASYLPYQGAYSGARRPALPEAVALGHGEQMAALKERVGSLERDAVQVDLSSEARALLQRLDASRETPALVTDAESVRVRLDERYERFSRLMEEMQNIHKELHGSGNPGDGLISLQWNAKRAKEQLPGLLERYETLRQTEPKAAIELTGKDKDAAWALAKSLGHSPWGDNYVFVHDNVMYSFKSDGTVTANDGNIPTSEESKRASLEWMARRISEYRGYSTVDIDAVSSRIDALNARLTEIRAELHGSQT